MENGKRDKSVEAKRLVKDNEYDMVPTRLKPVSATANGITFSTQMEQKKQPREARIPGKANKKHMGTFDQSRVKSSIPGASANSSRQLKPYKQRQTKENAANYVEELKRVECERAVQIESEQEMTQEILERMRDNPNAELF